MGGRAEKFIQEVGSSQREQVMEVSLKDMFVIASWPLLPVCHEVSHIASHVPPAVLI